MLGRLKGLYMSQEINGMSFKEWKALSDANVNIVKKANDAIGAGDGEALLSLFSDDMEFRMRGSTPFSGRLKGKQAFAELFGRVAERLENMIKLKVNNLISAGEWVITEVKGDAKTKEGVPYQNTYCQIWRIQNGKITQLTEYNDTQLIMDTFFKT